QRRGCTVQFDHAVLEAIFAQREAVRPEGVRLHDVAPHFQERGMDRLDRVRPRKHEMVVAAVQLRAAEIRGAQIQRLDARAHCAVIDQDAASERCEVRAVGHAPLVFQDEKSPTGRMLVRGYQRPWESMTYDRLSPGTLV